MTVLTTSKAHYHVVRETTDILYDYADKALRGRYHTLAEASEAVRTDLLSDYQPSALEDYEETTTPHGLRVTAAIGDVEFQVYVVHKPPLPELHPEERRVYLVLKTEVAGKNRLSAVVGIYRSDDGANEVAEKELRRAAGIGNWVDRRKFRGVYREGYNLEGLFEGVVRRIGEDGGAVEVDVVVEGRMVE